MSLAAWIGVVFVAALVLVGSAVAYVWVHSRDAQQAADAWFSLLRSQPLERAHAATSAAFRQATPLDVLRDRVGRCGLLLAAPTEWPHRKVGRDAVLLASGYPTPQGPPAALAVGLVREQGQWRVDAVTIGPDTGTRLRRFYPVDAGPPGFTLQAGAPGR